jgi:hypothetical protein
MTGETEQPTNHLYVNPNEMAGLHPTNEKLRMWLADTKTPVREIQEYLHRIAYKPDPQQKDRPFELGKVALDVQLADQAAASANKLSEQTEKLIKGIADLVIIAEAQKQLAVKLEKQTNKLIKLTWGLIWLSVALVILSVVLLIK